MFCCESDCQAWAIVTLFSIESWLVGIIFCLQSTFFVCNENSVRKMILVWREGNTMGAKGGKC